MNEDANSRRSSQDSIESALDVLGRGDRTIRTESPSETLRGNRGEISKEFRQLRESGIISVFDQSRLGTRLDGGGEHDVFLDACPQINSQRVFKTTHSDHAGQVARAVKRRDGIIRIASDDATPSEYLERIQLHNEILGDEIRFEGLLQEKPGYSLVTSQPLISGSLPTRENVDAFLNSIGFIQKPDGFWFSEERMVGIVDTKPANFIESRDSGIHPIDLVIFVPTRTMLDVWNAQLS